jgi:hypothetical protein
MLDASWRWRFSNSKHGHDAPIYGAIEGIIEKSGTPYFSFKDLDENKPLAYARGSESTVTLGPAQRRAATGWSGPKSYLLP